MVRNVSGKAQSRANYCHRSTPAPPARNAVVSPISHLPCLRMLAPVPLLAPGPLQKPGCLQMWNLLVAVVSLPVQRLQQGRHRRHDRWVRQALPACLAAARSV